MSAKKLMFNKVTRHKPISLLKNELVDLGILKNLQTLTLNWILSRQGVWTMLEKQKALKNWKVGYLSFHDEGYLSFMWQSFSHFDKNTKFSQWGQSLITNENGKPSSPETGETYIIKAYVKKLTSQFAFSAIFIRQAKEKLENHLLSIIMFNGKCKFVYMRILQVFL